MALLNKKGQLSKARSYYTYKRNGWTLCDYILLTHLEAVSKYGNELDVELIWSRR